APALILLAISFLINYVDRGNVSVAGPILKSEFHLSGTQLGILFAAFFVSYTGMQFVMGWLVDHFDVNRILAAGFLLWSIATATTGIVQGFVLLLAMRLILGVGESVALPAGKATDSPTPRIRRMASKRTKPWTIPVVAVAIDQSRKPAARMRLTSK